MKFLPIALVVIVFLGIRFARARRRRDAEGEANTTPPPVEMDRSATTPLEWTAHSELDDVRLVAKREILERVRGRIFRVGTVVILLVVVAAIVVPSIHGASAPSVQTVGVVGSLNAQALAAIRKSGTQTGNRVHFVHESSVTTAEHALRTSKIDVAVVNDQELVLWLPATASASPADPVFIQATASYLGALRTFHVAGLTPSQLAKVEGAGAFPVRTLSSGTSQRSKPISLIGIVLLFVMLTQYCTWILIGVMQEKSSRVVEVLLAALRPMQLLGGKVLGIGLVALGQATLVVATALITATATGSHVLRGAAPSSVLCELLWLLLGYAFYCWVYAAAGSTAERQDQVQTLALPLSLPILIGYIYSITVVSSGSPDLLFKILAYFPPTAPFCMSALFGLGLVSWWQVLVSALITVGGIVVTARIAARIYRRAILQTQGRVRLTQLLRSS